MNKIKQWLGFTDYTSEIDQFLKDFNKKNQMLSESQCAEREKFIKRIFPLRDGVTPRVDIKTFWKNF